MDHNQQVEVVDYIQAGGNIYSVMEYVEGKSLYKSISEGQRFSEKQISHWAEEISSALIYLHKFEPRVIHADIKPSNIILKTDGTRLLTNTELMLLDIQTVMLRPSSMSLDLQIHTVR